MFLKTARDMRFCALVYVWLVISLFVASPKEFTNVLLRSVCCVGWRRICSSEILSRCALAVRNALEAASGDRISHAEPPIELCRRIVIHSDSAYRDGGVVWNA